MIANFRYEIIKNSVRYSSFWARAIEKRTTTDLPYFGRSRTKLYCVLAWAVYCLTVKDSKPQQRRHMTLSGKRWTHKEDVVSLGLLTTVFTTRELKEQTEHFTNRFIKKRCQDLQSWETFAVSWWKVLQSTPALNTELNFCMALSGCVL